MGGAAGGEGQGDRRWCPGPPGPRGHCQHAGAAPYLEHQDTDTHTNTDTHTQVLKICRLTQPRVSCVETPVWQRVMLESPEVRQLRTFSQAHAQTPWQLARCPPPLKPPSPASVKTSATFSAQLIKTYKPSSSSPAPNPSQASRAPTPHTPCTALLLKGWSEDQQQQQPLGAC